MILKEGVVAAPSVQVLIPPDLTPGGNAIKLFSSLLTQQTSKLESLFLGSFFQPRLILASIAESTQG